MTHEHLAKRAAEGDVIRHHHYFKAPTTFLFFHQPSHKFIPN
jgi:hypothetical protein